MKNKNIYIAGHKGLVGSALHRALSSRGYSNIITKTSTELDLRNTSDVYNFFETQSPEWIFLAAAKVGGIYANNTYPADFLLENLKIQNNIIEAAKKYKAKKLLFLGSSCIYPKHAPQPLKEEYLLTGSLERTNETYALAKIAGIKLCAAMNAQHKTNFISVMPSNLYGSNDNYHLENAHVLPTLIHRFHKAKQAGKKETIIWGTGTPLREFTYSDDFADACIFLMENYDAKDIGEFINIGSGQEVSIINLAKIIKEIIEFSGKIKLDSSKPDGTPRKIVDSTKIFRLGWKPKISLQEGIKLAYKDFLSNKDLRM